MKKTTEEILAELEEAKDLFKKMEALHIEERRRMKEDGKEKTRDYDIAVGSENAWQLAAEELEKILEGAAG